MAMDCDLSPDNRAVYNAPPTPFEDRVPTPHDSRNKFHPTQGGHSGRMTWGLSKVCTLLSQVSAVVTVTSPTL